MQRFRIRASRLVFPRRSLTSTAVRRREAFDPKNVERASDEVDVCIVGGGPAGLSAAIRLKQLEKEKGREVRVVVLEKGPEVGESPEGLAAVMGRILHPITDSTQSAIIILTLTCRRRVTYPLWSRPRAAGA
jgi:electron-transferring-flavoprotein dehydrogenase